MTIKQIHPIRACCARGLPSRLGIAALSVSVTLALGGCSGLLDVENPNNMQEEELENPTTASSLANGALSTVMRSVGAMFGPYAAVADEAVWIGSRDAWGQLDAGNHASPDNEFTDDAFGFVGEGRWMADEAIERLREFDAQGELRNVEGAEDRTPLIDAYLAGAISYLTIADMFDDFAFSDQQEAAPPIGPENMSQVYDQAITYLDDARVVAQEIGAADLETQILALRVRAHFSSALWTKLNPVETGSPLVNDAAANADAAELIARVGATTDYRFRMSLDTDDLAYAGEVSLAYNVNQRGELDISEEFRTLLDPITGERDPLTAATLTEFEDEYVYMPITLASAREAHLILAEAALASNDKNGFTTHINHVRSMDGLAPYSGQVAAQDMLEYERSVNLFLQGRRLADMYRFGELSPQWETDPAATTIQQPGTFFPITCIEIRAHPEDFAGTSC